MSTWGLWERSGNLLVNSQTWTTKKERHKFVRHVMYAPLNVDDPRATHVHFKQLVDLTGSKSDERIWRYVNAREEANMGAQRIHEIVEKLIKSFSLHVDRVLCAVHLDGPRTFSRRLFIEEINSVTGLNLEYRGENTEE